jgi:hypothetical protein
MGADVSRSKKQNRKALSALLVLIIVCLLSVAVVRIRHHGFLTGATLIAWSFLPLALLLLFVWPTLCRVQTRSGKACLNDAYGFLFGCNRYGHWRAKACARLGWQNGAERSIQPSRSTGDYAVMYQPAPGSAPMRVKIEDNGLTICGFWVGVAGLVVAVIQTVAAFALH